MKKGLYIFFLVVPVLFGTLSFHAPAGKLIVLTEITDMSNLDLKVYPMLECAFNEMPYNGKTEWQTTTKIEDELKKKYPNKTLSFRHTTNFNDMAKKYVVILWGWQKDWKGGYVKFYTGKIGLNRKETYEAALKQIQTWCGEKATVNVVTDKQY